MLFIKKLQEVIQDAKKRKRTAHISWFDLTDAFGSISHKLIQFCCKHFHTPEKEWKYIQSLYSQLRGRIVTKEWISKVFKFLKGIYQGDPFSSSIFLMVFQPLIDVIMSFKESHGYQLGETKAISTPFADDFDLISNHVKKYQNLMLDIQKKAESMGLTFKSSKCRSLSIQGGKFTDIKFFLLDGSGEKVLLNNMEDDPHKFLGSSITKSNSPADHFTFLKKKLDCKLNKLNEPKVRGEYKIAVYSRYILPSLPFHFSVHNIHKTHLDIHDQLARKSWLSFPSRGVTDLGIYHPSILGIKFLSQFKSHINSFISLKLSDDPVVRQTVACQLEREGAWVKKSSTAVECQEIFEKLSETKSIPMPGKCSAATRRMELQRLKKAGKSIVAEKYKERASEFNLSVPRGVMAFAARSTTNSLASPYNLARWKKIVNPKCPFCSISPCTLGHLLSSFHQVLNRY